LRVYRPPVENPRLPKDSYIVSNIIVSATLNNPAPIKETVKQFTLTATLVIYLLNSACGQSKTYFGLEFSVASDIYKITDTGDYLMTIPLVNAQGGFNIRQEVTRSIFVEAGLTVKDNWEGFGFKTIPYYGAGGGELLLIIPVRFGLNLNLYKGKICLVPVVGYSFGINHPFGYGGGYGNQTSGSTSIDYYYMENPDVSRYFSLVQTGIGFEFTLFKTLLFSVSTNYYKGFNKTTHLDITYTVNNSSPMTGTAITTGEFWCVSTGLKYPISNLWTTKK
jgi:hypothetical protein